MNVPHDKVCPDCGSYMDWYKDHFECPECGHKHHTDLFDKKSNKSMLISQLYD